MPYQKPAKKVFTDRLFKTLLCLLATVVCAFPAELWFGIYKYASPEGFWQKFALVGGGLVVFGAFQFFLFIVWIVALMFIITEL